MVRDPRRHGWGRLLRRGQTRMGCAEVIDCADHEHALVQRHSMAGQRTAPARQRCEAFSERRVQSLNVRGVDHPAALRATAQCLDACWRALNNAALCVDDATTLVTFDDLRDQDMAPWTQPWSSALAGVYRIAKGLANGSEVGHQAIGTNQQRTVRSTTADPLDQPPDQRQVALLTDFPAKPQPGLHHHGHGHPDNTALLLDA